MQPTLANRISKLEQAAENRPMTDEEIAETERECRELVQLMMSKLVEAGMSPSDARAELIAHEVDERHF